MNYFIVNPKSGSKASTDLIRKVSQFLRNQKHPVHIEHTRSLAHAEELALHAGDMHANRVIVAGGDGTVRAVLQGLVGKNIPILILPCGTENLLARQLGLNAHPETAIAAIQHGNIQKLDLGTVNGHYFTSVVGVGFDAEVVHRVHNNRAGHITHRTYLFPIVRTFCRHQFPQLDIHADGQTIFTGKAMAFVSNISRYAIGLGINPKANPSDGLLDLCVYPCDNRARLLALAIRTVLHKSHQDPNVIRRQAKHIYITSPSQYTFTQSDGDPGPPLPLDIHVVPSAIDILSPPPDQ